MELLAKGSRVALDDAAAMDNLRFTAARLAEAAARRPDYRPDREYASELARSLWPRLGYVCNPAQRTEIETVFGHAVECAVAGDAPPDSNPPAAPSEAVNTDPDDDDLPGPSPAEEEAPGTTSSDDGPQAVTEYQTNNNITNFGAATADQPAAAPTTAAAADGTVTATTEAEPYRFDTCTVTLTVTLLPASGDARARRAVIGVRTHESAPAITCRLVRCGGVGGDDAMADDISAAIGEAIAQCRADMPLRAAEAMRKASKSQAGAKKSSKKSRDAYAAAAPAAAAKPELFEADTPAPAAQVQQR